MAQTTQQISRQQAEEFPLPTIQNTALLKACLAPKAEPALFSLWRNSIDFETELGGGAFRLLPLLYYRYRNICPDDELMARLKGIYRNSWSKNNILIYAADPALRILLENNLRVILLKGLPLAFGYYKNLALRPMADVDLLIPHQQREEAVNLLVKNGYRIKEDAPLHYIYRALRSVTLVKEQIEIDLHWSPLMESFGLQREELFWGHTVQIEVGDLVLETLDATGHFFHTIIHGFKRNPEPPIRWIADSVIIYKQSNDIDWSRLWHLAQVHGVILQLQRALQFLAKEFSLSIPDDFKKRLQNYKASYSQKLLYQYALSDGWQFKPPSTFKETVRMHFFLHLRKSNHHPFGLQLLFFIGYTGQLILDTPLFFLRRFSTLLFQSFKRSV